MIWTYNFQKGGEEKKKRIMDRMDTPLKLKHASITRHPDMPLSIQDNIENHKDESWKKPKGTAKANIIIVLERLGLF